MLPLLEASVRTEAVHGMASGLPVPVEAKARVARMVAQRLAANRRQSGDRVSAAPRDPQLRKVALLLRGLSREMRDNMLTAVRQKDAPAADSIKKLMVIWEDLSAVSERNLQQVLRDCGRPRWPWPRGRASRHRRQDPPNISDAKAMLDEEVRCRRAQGRRREQARQQLAAGFQRRRELTSEGT